MQTIADDIDYFYIEINDSIIYNSRNKTNLKYIDTITLRLENFQQTDTIKFFYRTDVICSNCDWGIIIMNEQKEQEIRIISDVNGLIFGFSFTFQDYLENRKPIKNNISEVYFVHAYSTSLNCLVCLKIE